MDPTYLAIVGALSAGAISGATDIAKKAIADSYEGLKQLIKAKFGHTSEVASALDKLEAKPESPARKLSLEEELSDAKVSDDADLRSAVESLLDLIKALPHGEQRIQQIALGNNNMQVVSGGPVTFPMSRSKE
jgi:hypothetical protein